MGTMLSRAERCEGRRMVEEDIEQHAIIKNKNRNGCRILVILGVGVRL